MVVGTWGASPIVEPSACDSSRVTLRYPILPRVISSYLRPFMQILIMKVIHDATSNMSILCRSDKTTMI